MARAGWSYIFSHLGDAQTLAFAVGFGTLALLVGVIVANKRIPALKGRFPGPLFAMVVMILVSWAAGLQDGGEVRCLGEVPCAPLSHQIGARVANMIALARRAQISNCVHPCCSNHP